MRKQSNKWHLNTSTSPQDANCCNFIAQKSHQRAKKSDSFHSVPAINLNIFLWLFIAYIEDSERHTCWLHMCVRAGSVEQERLSMFWRVHSQAWDHSRRLGGRAAPWLSASAFEFVNGLRSRLCMAPRLEGDYLELCISWEAAAASISSSNLKCIRIFLFDSNLRLIQNQFNILLLKKV
jgi:hypothetical protein